MPRILGMELTGKKLAVGGAVIAGLLLAYIYIRSKGASSPVAAPDQGQGLPGGGGGGMAYSGPPESPGDQLALEQQRLELERQKFEYGEDQAEGKRRASLFDLSYTLQQAEAALGIQHAKLEGQAEQAQFSRGQQIADIGQQALVAKFEGKKSPFGSEGLKATCPVGEPKVNPETGEIYCRTQAGGFKPLKQILGAVVNTVTDAIPAIGQAYTTRLTGQITGPKRPRKRQQDNTHPLYGGSGNEVRLV